MERVLILGAAGRDFHTFNVCFRDNPDYQVVAFTAAQIPGIENRLYPPALSGARYPEGIPIYPEERLEFLIRNERILRAVEGEADIILWDGGNNDWPFFRPDLEVVLLDPHRPGHELLFLARRSLLPHRSICPA